MLGAVKTKENNLLIQSAKLIVILKNDNKQYW